MLNFFCKRVCYSNTPFNFAIALQTKYARPGVKVFNAIQSNGYLIDLEWAKFLSENQLVSSAFEFSLHCNCKNKGCITMTHPFRKKVKHKLFNFHPDRQARKHPCKQSGIAPVLIGSPGQSRE